MGLFSFIKSAGAAIGIGSEPKSEELAQAAEELGLPAAGLDVAVDGDTVKLSGSVDSQEEKEKLILAMGNVAGVASVEDSITVASPAPEAVFYTVVSGDNLSTIAKNHYGKASAYPAIFEANKPMLSHPDKIYPGQVLRIPPQS